MRVGSIIEQTDRLSTLLQKLIDLDYNSLALIKTITDSHGISLHVNEITHVDMNSMIQAMFNPESHFEPYLKLMNTLETTKINPLMRFEKLQKVLGNFILFLLFVLFPFILISLLCHVIIIIF